MQKLLSNVYKFYNIKYNEDGFNLEIEKYHTIYKEQLK